MPKNPSPYILHIVDAAAQIAQYLENLDEESFRANRLVQDAVVRQLEIIGVACAKLEDNYKKSHPHIPWTQIVGMRNKLEPISIPPFYACRGFLATLEMTV